MAALQTVLEKLDPMRCAPRSPPPRPARRARCAPRCRRAAGQLHAELCRLPDGFTLHPRLARIRQRRERMMDDPGLAAIDWSTAEELALATILEDGTPIRLTGQDVERGTFSHRHAVLHDVNSNQRLHVPLQQLPQAGRL
jgi:2-oxoglutarate dehydrogenase E1 component